MTVIYQIQHGQALTNTLCIEAPGIGTEILFLSAPAKKDWSARPDEPVRTGIARPGAHKKVTLIVLKQRQWFKGRFFIMPPFVSFTLLITTKLCGSIFIISVFSLFNSSLVITV